MAPSGRRLDQTCTTSSGTTYAAADFPEIANEPEYFEAVGVAAFRAGAAVEALAGTSTLDVANRADAEIARTERLRMRMSLMSLATHPSDGPSSPR